MSEKKYLDLEGLTQVANNVKTRLKTVTTMPETADAGAIRLYVGEDSENYKKGHIYEASGDPTVWTDITVTGLKVVDQMPLVADNDETVLYIGPQINGYVPGTIYKFDAQQSVVVNITTSASSGSMFNNQGFFRANDIDNLPSTVNSWTLNSVDKPEILKQWITNQEPVRVKTGVLVVGVMETTDPMVIGSNFWALVAYNTTASEVETLDVTLTNGSNSWINLTQVTVDSATSELRRIVAEKADKFQYSSLPSPSEQFVNKLIQNTNTSAFYTCSPKGESTVITTASQLRNYVQTNGSSISIVQMPFANTTKSMLIDGYQYYYDNFISAFVRIQTDTFLTSVDSRWLPAVTDEEAAELDISYYPEGYEWKLVNAQIHLNPTLSVEFLQSIPATEFDGLNFPDGEFDYQLGFYDNNGTLVYKVWDASQSYWRDLGSINEGAYDDYGYVYINVETVIGIKTAYNVAADEEARETAAGAMALAAEALEKAEQAEPESIPSSVIEDLFD